MNTKKNRKHSTIILTVFLTLFYALIADLFWITLVAGPLYHSAFPSIIEIKLVPAALFYLLFSSGLYYFAVIPCIDKMTLEGIVRAGFFGLNVYGGYALTVLAVFNFFTPIMACLEMLWGMVISIVVTTATIKTLALFR